MAKYSDEFRLQAIAKVENRGIKPCVRELKISRNALRRWLRAYDKGGFVSLIKHRPSHRRFAPELEDLVIAQKEQNPGFTLKKIKEIVEFKTGMTATLKSVHCILERHGMTAGCYLPFKAADTVEIQKGMKTALFLLKQKRIKKTAEVLNSLPALSDFSILEKIPSKYLSLRRRAEQLEALWDVLPIRKINNRARNLRLRCEKKKLLFTAIFLSAIEMDSLHFLGRSAAVISLYSKYHKYLPGLPASLKYRFLLQVVVSCTYMPKKRLDAIFKKFPSRFERFCARLPQGNHRVYWYDAISAYYQVIGEIGVSLQWMERLLQEVTPELKSAYLPEFLSLLATKGAYSEILKFNDFHRDASPYLFLRISLARANALLGTGNPKEALDIVLNAFYVAKKEHLFPTMAGFAFFISCAYNALKDEKRANRYVKTSLLYSKNIRRYETLFSLVLGLKPPALRSRDTVIHLVERYLHSCRTLRKKDYYSALNLAADKGLLGFLHRVILIKPEAVMNILKKGKDTRLPEGFLALPLFEDKKPALRLFLLKKKEVVFCGDRKLDISTRCKDFHLLVYLLLNRKKRLDRDAIINIFYRHTAHPLNAVVKALSRIRSALGLRKGMLSARRKSMYFDIEAKIDIEEFEQLYKIGKVFQKSGEEEQALQEYQTCFELYQHDPFEKIGYYYNFAEERRTMLKNMYQDLSGFLLTRGRAKGDFMLMRRLREKRTVPS